MSRTNASNNGSTKDWNDSVVLDTRELRMKWAVDDATAAAQKLIDLMERQANLEMIETVSEYLGAMNTYVQIAGEYFRVNQD